MKRTLAVFAMLLLLMTPIFGYAQPEDDGEMPVEEFPAMDFVEERAKAVVQEVKVEQWADESLVMEVEMAKVKVLSGPYKDQILTVENPKTGNPAYDISLTEGDRVILLLEIVDGEVINGYVEDFYRLDKIMILVGLFVLAILAMGRWKGLRALFSLVVTIALVTQVLIPQALNGKDPLWLAVGVAVVSIIVTLVVVGGFSLKSLSAIIGTTGGVFVSGILALVFSKVGHLTGLSSQEAQFLLYVPQGDAYNFGGLLLAGIIIGALGAIMDIGISIASAVQEVSKANANITAAGLWRSGMNVGRDVMGTMTNTLILAYAGASLPLLMLFQAYDMPLMKVLNMDLVTSEIVRALSGSIGLVCCIPLTAIVSALVYTRLDKSQSEN